MRIVFMGTPEFALPSLRTLLEHGYNVVSVVTTPDKPQGRGQKIGTSPVREFAVERNLPVLQPGTLRDPAFVSGITGLRPDLIVVVAFRILPPEVFTIPRLGSFNLHASLLPKFRGAAPIQWAIMKGEEETGVTTFLLQEKVDTGSVLLQARVRIGPDETAGELHDRLAELGAQVVLQTVRSLEVGNAKPLQQDHTQASQAPKLFRENGEIHWNAPAKQIHNLVRGLSPSPCAWTKHHGKVIRIYRTECIDRSDPELAGRPGEILHADANSVRVGTTNGVIGLLEVQQEGRKRMGIAEFLRGYPLKAGDKLGKS
ncbi:MAG TPA: methionyl-tRNA formyltransferase [Bacteroidota bacterium]|nr:methionyl-tRNA formyltransferase [Bacteroidota bacterium]